MNQEKDKEPINDELYKDVAKEFDISPKIVKDIIVNGQSKLTTSIMANNTFDSIRWPYIGVFKAKIKVANILNYMKGLTPEQKKFFQDQFRMKNKEKIRKMSEEKKKQQRNSDDKP
jgi:hypothetical protein